MKSRLKPIVSWSIWAGGLSLVMGIVTRNQLLAGFKSDETGMTYVIAALFGAGLIVSFRAAWQLHSEWGVLSRITTSNQIPISSSRDDLASVFKKLATHKRNGETVDIHTSIDTYHAGHNSRVRSVSIMAALVISMGLLGTVVGLIMSISGLGGMVENIGLSRATMMAALKTTVAGMGTAFYTTFFGALGGLVLRAVAVSQLNSLSELCAAATEYADAKLTLRADSMQEEINQQITGIIDSFENMQQEIEAVTIRIGQSAETAIDQLTKTLKTAGDQALGSIDECTTNMAGQFKMFTAELDTTYDNINHMLGQSGERMDLAFGNLDVSVNEASNAISGSLIDFRQSIDGTSTELNKAVHLLENAISKATGTMKTMAEARLDTEAQEIAGQLSLAAESIQRFVQIKSNSQNTEQKKVA